MRTLTTVLMVTACAQAMGCPANADLTVRDLMGQWRAEFESGRPPITLRLQSNPDWPGSVAGRFMHEGRTIEVAGDLEDGVFTLEESADGMRIDAIWTGQPIEGSCGREIRGTWRSAGPDNARAAQGFFLRKTPGW